MHANLSVKWARQDLIFPQILSSSNTVLPGYKAKDKVITEKKYHLNVINRFKIVNYNLTMLKKESNKKNIKTNVNNL